MKATERTTRIKSVKEKTEDALQDKKYLLVIEGTGWGKVLNEIMEVRETLTYAELGIPGAEDGQAEDVEGHGEPALEIGEVDGVPVIRVKKMHAYANLSNPDAREAMYIIIAALKDSVRGAIMTAGAGALFCPEDPEDQTAEQLAAWEDLVKQGKSKRDGRDFEILEKGTIGVVETVLPQYAGGMRHSFTGVFPDPCHGNQDKDTQEWVHSGIHSHDGKWINYASKVLADVQDGHAPTISYVCMVGPDFEPPQLKKICLSDGADAVGMSLYASQVALSELGIPFVGYVLITNGVEPHSHAGNSAVGESQAGKIERLAKKAITEWPDAEAA